MAWVGNYIHNTLLTALFGTTIENHTDEEGEPCSKPYSSDRYRPSVRDVIGIKEALHKKSTLPYELVDTIVDMAEYWPHTTTTTQQETRVRAGHDRENMFILRSYPLGYPHDNCNPVDGWQMLSGSAETYTTLQPKPWPESRSVTDDATEEILSQWASKSLPKGEYPCRKIVFTVRGHDQGWGGTMDQRGTYVGSFTWFDVGLERMTACREATLQEKPDLAPEPQFHLNPPPTEPTSEKSPVTCHLRTIIPATRANELETDADSFHHELLPSGMAIQKNNTASRDSKEHKVTWLSSDNVIPDSLDAVELEKQGRGRESANGEFVRNLKVGDVVTVWAKARFPQWINFVEKVRIDVFWAV